MTSVRIIAIAGGSGSGKTWLAEHLRSHLKDSVAVVSMDWYYKDLSHLPKDIAARANFDHPDAIELPLLLEQLDRLSQHKPIEAPAYSFSRYSRVAPSNVIAPAGTVIIEGLYALWHSEIRRQATHSIFVHLPQSLCLARRVRRDGKERGYSPKTVLDMWARHTSPMFREFVAPSRQYAQFVWEATKPIDSGPQILQQSKIARD